MLERMRPGRWRNGSSVELGLKGGGIPDDNDINKKSRPESSELLVSMMVL